MNTIVLLTDFSDPARHAFEALLTVAKQTYIQRVIIYHSYGYTTHHVHPVGGVMIPPPPMLPDAKETADTKTKLRLMQEELLNISPTTQVRSWDDQLLVEDALHEITQSTPVDLVIMGIQGADDNGQNSIGTIPNSLIQMHAYNIMLVPSMRQSFSIKQALLAVDLDSLQDRLPVDTIYHLQDIFKLQWHVVNVNLGKPVKADLVAANIISEQRYLHDTLDKLDPTYAYVADEDLVSGVTTYAALHNIDILVTVPRKLGFFASLFHSRSSKKLALHTNIPILMLVK
ncbi:hypothetical protein FAZ15_13955 [Sphingobacterium olei]|uniref:Universal stress protein n=1 Tax=Sphingobacterium olei TaxID=2571155 RepID=A0A4U0NYN9_9SPHI|nr:hypothetical protein [Sphingobacterium olei]TJZ59987.1 hypothetical protein FAZ15_13955 [Sphingobacterium olei]